MVAAKGWMTQPAFRNRFLPPTLRNKVVENKMESDMDDEIARVRAHHIEDFRRIAMTLVNLAKDAEGLLRRWEAELNPGEESTERFEGPNTVRPGE
jgi:hypothetical protein